LASRTPKPAPFVYPIPEVPDLIMPDGELLPSAPTDEAPALSDEALHALATRLGRLHDDFAREDFVFRVRVGQELVRTLYAGRFELYHEVSRYKAGSFARFLAHHGADLEARGLSVTVLRRCIRAAEVVPDPTALPSYVTFSHVVAIMSLPAEDRAGWLARLALEPMSVRELQAQLGERPGDQEDRPTPSPGYAGNVPRRLQSVADALSDIPTNLAVLINDRPEVAAEAVQKLLGLKEQIDWWLTELGVGVGVDRGEGGPGARR